MAVSALFLSHWILIIGWRGEEEKFDMAPATSHQRSEKGQNAGRGWRVAREWPRRLAVSLSIWRMLKPAQPALLSGCGDDDKCTMSFHLSQGCHSKLFLRPSLWRQPSDFFQPSLPFTIHHRSPAPGCCRDWCQTAQLTSGPTDDEQNNNLGRGSPPSLQLASPASPSASPVAPKPQQKD